MMCYCAKFGGYAAMLFVAKLLIENFASLGVPSHEIVVPKI